MELALTKILIQYGLDTSDCDFVKLGFTFTSNDIIESTVLDGFSQTIPRPDTQAISLRVTLLVHRIGARRRCNLAVLSINTLIPE